MANKTEPRLSIDRPSPMNLPLFLPYATAQLQAPYRVRILIETQEDYVSKANQDRDKKLTKAKSNISHHTSSPPTRTESQEQQDDVSDSPTTYVESDEIVITAVHDTASRLVELNFNRCTEIPRSLMQIIAFCIPYQHFLSKLVVRWVPLEAETLYEIAKFLPGSQLTDICLDDSPVPEKNYHSLLDQSQLKRLSLARCDLDDDDCVAMAAKLAHPLPASRSLCVLSLVSNTISDDGACALAKSLRSNRALQYLNLAGNRITDIGACALFHSVTEFPLTYEELITKRRQLIDYLRMRKEVYLRCLNELKTTWLERQADESSRTSKRRNQPVLRSRKVSVASSSTVAAYTGTLDAVALRADTMANDLLGSHFSPFGLEETVSKDGYVYSLGNTALCVLNLSYNDLGYASVVALHEVLQYQGGLVHKAGPGLLRVTLDGNQLPCTCPEYNAIQVLLERAIHWKISKALKKSDKSKSKGRLL